MKIVGSKEDFLVLLRREAAWGLPLPRGGYKGVAQESSLQQVYRARKLATIKRVLFARIFICYLRVIAIYVHRHLFVQLV